MADPRPQLRQTVIAAFADAVNGATSCGLVDFPRHMNVGDSAIWIGEREILAGLGVQVRVATDSTTYDDRRFRHRLGDAPVFFHGGGNFGGLYDGPQAFRERIFSAYADRPIVQLPQTVNFVTDRQREQMASLISAHGDVTLMVRDRESAEAAAELGARVILAPDPALALDIPRPVAATRDVVRLSRTDDESRQADAAVAGVDWLEESNQRDRLINEWHKLELGVTAGRLEGGGAWLPSLAVRAYDRYAAWNVRRGTRLLATGRVVITDRLHAHILSALMGIPHVLIDDRYGKVSRFWRAWTSELPFARFAVDADEAGQLAASLLDADGASP
jgi:exopolysaccharide biosynthesis predicted pyruvyltransferase EpsI